MDFFTKISEHLDSYTVQLTVEKADDELIVMLVPKLKADRAESDKVQEAIQPLVLRGKPEDIDVGFFPAVSNGLKETGLLQANVLEFEAGLKEAAKKASNKKETPAQKKAREKKEAEEKTEKKPDLFAQGEKKEAARPKTDPNQVSDAEHNSAKPVDDMPEHPVAETKAPVPGGGSGAFKRAETTKEEPAKEEPAGEDPVAEGASNDGFGDEEW